MPLIHKTGSVFSALPGSVLVHSCNAQGVWGAGVAEQMRHVFPGAFEHYRNTVVRMPLGSALLFEERGYFIASLIVSEHFGRRKGSPSSIALYTIRAVADLLHPTTWGRLNRTRPADFHSPRINAGLFAVPWSRTEASLASAITLQEAIVGPLNWTVWTPE